MKMCTRCKEEKPLDAFGPHKGKLDGLQSWCRECTNKQGRKGYNKNRLDRFSLTQAQYDAMVEDQDNRCAICGRTETSKAWAIDHDHACCPGQNSCGKCVRGLLCSNCNTALGLFGDSVESLRRAIDYLQPK